MSNLLPENDLEWGFFFGCAWTIFLLVFVPLLSLWIYAIIKKYIERGEK